MAYPQKPTGNNIIPEDMIFASNNSNKIVMSTQEILNGYNNDGDLETALTSRPDANRFNNFWYQMQNSLVWLIKYAEELYADKLSKAGGAMTGFLNMGSNKITCNATPTQNNDLVNKQYVDNRINGAMWISEIKMLAYPAVPQLTAGIEIVPCDGRAISRTDYAELFSLIGTAFGAGNDSTTFNIPDYRGLFLRGWSGGSGRDSSRIYGQIQQSGAPNITANIRSKALRTESGNGTVFSSVDGALKLEEETFTPINGVGGGSVGRNETHLVTFSASRSSNIYQNGLNEIRPTNSTCYYVIRIK